MKNISRKCCVGWCLIFPSSNLHSMDGSILPSIPSHEHQRQGLALRQQVRPQPVSCRTSIHGNRDGSIHHNSPSHEHQRQHQGLVLKQQSHPQPVSFRTSIHGNRDGSILHNNPSHEHQHQRQGLVLKQQSHPQPVSCRTIHVHSSKDGSILCIHSKRQVQARRWPGQVELGQPRASC